MLNLSGKTESFKNPCKSTLTLAANYVVIDIETTGLSPKKEHIIELAAVRVRGGHISDSFESLILPPVLPSAFITQLTGISPAMLCGAPALCEKLADYLAFIGSDLIVGHNVSFDIGFINHACLRHDLPPLTNDFADTMRLSRKFYPDMPNHRLATLISHLAVAPAVSHRAHSDACQTHYCYERMRSDAFDRAQNA